MIITAPNEFARDWLEGQYSQLISGLLYEIIGEDLNVKFIIPPQEEDEGSALPAVKNNVKEKRINRLISKHAKSEVYI